MVWFALGAVGFVSNSWAFLAERLTRLVYYVPNLTSITQTTDILVITSVAPLNRSEVDSNQCKTLQYGDSSLVAPRPASILRRDVVNNDHLDLGPLPHLNCYVDRIRASAAQKH